MAKEFDCSGIGQAFKGITDAIVARAYEEANGDDAKHDAFTKTLCSGNRRFFMYKLSKHMYVENCEKVSRYFRILLTAKDWRAMTYEDRRLWDFLMNEVVPFLKARHFKIRLSSDDGRVAVIHPDGSIHGGDPSKKVTDIWRIGH